MTVFQLFAGDKRAQVLEAAILATVYERGNGLPLPLVLGVLRLIEHRLMTDAGAP